MCCNFNGLGEEVTGRCTEWGSGGREFKSHRPDQKIQRKEQLSNMLGCSFFVDLGVFGFYDPYMTPTLSLRSI